MSPATMDDHEYDHGRCLQSLAKAFEGLLQTAHQLSCREHVLQQRLKYAHTEYVKLADRLGADGHTRAVAQEIISSRPDSGKSLKPADAVKSLTELGYLEGQVVTVVSEGLECYQSVVHPEPNGYPVASGTSGQEKDFTTHGTKGTLGCPFSQMHGSQTGIENPHVANVDTCGQEDLDPIKAESNDKRSTNTPSGVSSAVRCPIRFMNQHSPQEVAEYVERHKHELPRSHTVCVQRYNKNSETRRQIDAKYGGTTSMIQGLGVKHQSFLPKLDEDRVPNGISNSVEKWAADVDSKSMQVNTEEESEERKGHFDRPLREVRLGESPSRPWGIPIPVERASVSHSPTAPVPTSHEVVADNDTKASADPLRNGSRGVCPIPHGNPGKGPQTKVITDDEAKESKNTAELEGKLGRVVFTGPVFFGYTAEQTAGLMQELAKLGNLGNVGMNDLGSPGK